MYSRRGRVDGNSLGSCSENLGSSPNFARVYERRVEGGSYVRM